MKDEEIVELYWQRSEDAIKETSCLALVKIYITISVRYHLQQNF